MFDSPGAADLAAWQRRHGPLGPDAKPALVLAGTDGAWVETLDGRRLLDFSCGGVLPLGHNHPAVLEAQAKSVHTRPGDGQEWPERLALTHKLAEIAPGGMNRRVMLCETGREALGQAICLAQKVTGRRGVMYLTECAEQRPGVSPDKAAVIVHPFDARVESVAESCAASGTLLIDDESLIAPGTSGRMLAIEWTEARPDFVVLGTGLAAGESIGACIAGKAAWHWDRAVSGPGPMASAVALEYLRLLEQGLVESGRVIAGKLKQGLAAIAGRAELYGAGLALSLRLPTPDAAQKLAGKCLSGGLLLARVGRRSIGVWPPLVATADEIEQAVSIIAQAKAG